MTVREERKQLSRLAFLEAALVITQQKRTFSSMSLRELAQKVQLVPSAFYRHFKDLDHLGLELVDYVALHLKYVLVNAVQNIQQAEKVQQILELSFQQKPDIWHFVLAERWSGSSELRLSLEQEIMFITEDVYAELQRHFMFQEDCQDQYQQFAHLFVQFSFIWAMQWFSSSSPHPSLIQPAMTQQIELLYNSLKYTC